MPRKDISKAPLAVLILAVVFLVTVSLLGCGSTNVPKRKLTIKIDWLPSAEYYGIFLAKDKGWFEDAGFDVTIESGQGAPMLAAELAAQSIKVGTTSSDQILKQIVAGYSFEKCVALNKFNPTAIISLAENPVLTFEKLQGTRLGVNISSVTYKQYNYIVSKIPNFNRNAVVEIPIGWGGPAFLIQGQVNAILHYVTNLGVDLELKEKEIRTIMFNDLPKPMKSLHSFATVLCFAKQSPSSLDRLSAKDMNVISEVVLRGYLEGEKNQKSAIKALTKAEPTLKERKLENAIPKIINFNKTSKATPQNIDSWVEASAEDRERAIKLYR